MLQVHLLQLIINLNFLKHIWCKIKLIFYVDTQKGTAQEKQFLKIHGPERDIRKYSGKTYN
jgi:hypothetical protein